MKIVIDRNTNIKKYKYKNIILIINIKIVNKIRNSDKTNNIKNY